MPTDDCLKCDTSPPRKLSKWCEKCYYPGIDDDYNELHALLEDGYRYVDACVMSGWKGVEEI